MLKKRESRVGSKNCNRSSLKTYKYNAVSFTQLQVDYPVLKGGQLKKRSRLVHISGQQEMKK